MKRRDFIQVSAPIVAGTALSLGLRSTLRHLPYPAHHGHDKVLVLVQLDGGNDGLNTVIPLDQYKALSAARKDLLIPDQKVIRLKHTDTTAFHPAMPELARLFDDGRLTVVQGVGYPDPVFSHFRATDIWHTASASGQVLDTGWLGRYLDSRYPGYPQQYPTEAVPDPPAIQVGSVLSTSLQGPRVGMGMTVTTTREFYDIVTSAQDMASARPMAQELAYINSVASQTKDYLARVKKAAGLQKNLSRLYPDQGTNPLADQLRIVAQLIGGGMTCPVYVVNLMEFDTHHNQVDHSDPTRGTHAHLLSQVSAAIAAFEDDLHLMGRQDDVLGMVYSEFGRRIKANASFGTDHGSSGPVFMFGARLRGGLVGVNPHIPDTVSVEDNLTMQHDFRAVYASVLRGWFGVGTEELSRIIPGSYPAMDFFV